MENEDENTQPTILGNARLDAISEIDSDAAKEIRRLQTLMTVDEEMKDEEFLRLCQLLHDVGETIHGESLLRCNVEDVEGAEPLYIRL
ncbi:MAG: hypothetical protein N2C14_13070, partial [Planctomycetales bacterium]